MSPAGIIEKARQRGVSLALTADGTGLSLSSDDDLPEEIVSLLKNHKQEIVAHIQAERGRINRWIADKLIDWPPSHCLHCKGQINPGQKWTIVSNGDVSARFHADCHPRWLEAQETRARNSLGLA